MKTTVYIHDDYRPYVQILGDPNRILDRRQRLSLVADAYLPSCSSTFSRSGFTYSWRVSQGGIDVIDVIDNTMLASSATFTISPGSLIPYKAYDVTLTVTSSKSGRGVTNIVHVNVIATVTANIKGIDIIINITMTIIIIIIVIIIINIIIIIMIL